MRLKEGEFILMEVASTPWRFGLFMGSCGMFRFTRIAVPPPLPANLSLRYRW